MLKIFLEEWILKNKTWIDPRFRIILIISAMRNKTMQNSILTCGWGEQKKQQERAEVAHNHLSDWNMNW